MTQEYLDRMFLIVEDALSLASQFGVTLPEKLATAKTWARVLFDVVPEDRLQDSFDFAFQSHTSNFPLTAYEIKTAWGELEKLEIAEKERLIQEEREQNPVLFCRDRVHHINDFGEIKVLNPFDFSEEIVLPCATCRPKAYDNQRALFIANHGKPKPLEVLENIVEFNRKKKEL